MTMQSPSAIRWLSSLLLIAVLVGCTPDAEPEDEPAPVSQPGAADPAAAVSELMVALSDGDFERASQLTVDDQMLAIAVTGNASVEALQGVLETGGADIGANYWESFVENLEGFLGITPAEVTMGEVETLEVDGVEFAKVAVDIPGDSINRRFVVQRTDGWKVDVVATFAPALAQRLGRAAESFGADPTASDILASLVRQRPSLEVALEDPATDPETAQVIRTAIVSMGG
jgi:hypothetical protein